MTAAALLALAAALLGAILASRVLRDRVPPRGLRLLHGSCGATALTLAVIALAASGWQASAFTWDAVALLGIALALGLTIGRATAGLGAQRGLVVLLHATAGLLGAVLLAAWFAA